MLVLCGCVLWVGWVRGSLVGGWWICRPCVCTPYHNANDPQRTGCATCLEGELQPILARALRGGARDDGALDGEGHAVCLDVCCSVWNDIMRWDVRY